MRFVLCVALLAAAGVISGVAADEAFLLAHDGDATTHHRSRSRTLLDASKPCPVDFAAANYTVLTSRCSWPPFDPSRCCPAFKDFACPYVNYLNNNNDCSVTMFQYIHFYGNYRPGLFFHNCNEGPKGVECPDDTPLYRPSTAPPPL
ncbi:GPI-anchored protein LLG1-like [Triticum urartu]|uniref:GPI-anchored protein LLG1-like n=1 Tax=Triticum urartu TaxID=4572 RepID=UPI001E1EEC99|nr:GPI-anchored protein LLG1-like [Triticum urartu]